MFDKHKQPKESKVEGFQNPYIKHFREKFSKQIGGLDLDYKGEAIKAVERYDASKATAATLQDRFEAPFPPSGEAEQGSDLDDAALQAARSSLQHPLSIVDVFRKPGLRQYAYTQQVEKSQVKETLPEKKRAVSVSPEEPPRLMFLLLTRCLRQRPRLMHLFIRRQCLRFPSRMSGSFLQQLKLKRQLRLYSFLYQPSVMVIELSFDIKHVLRL